MKTAEELGEEPPKTGLGCRALLSGVLRQWNSSMGRICANADYSELEIGAENVQILHADLSMRQEFLTK